jgi:hypothetical protein
MSLLPVRITLDIEADDTFNLNVIQLISIKKNWSTCGDNEDFLFSIL